MEFKAQDKHKTFKFYINNSLIIIFFISHLLTIAYYICVQIIGQVKISVNKWLETKDFIEGCRNIIKYANLINLQLPSQ